MIKRKDACSHFHREDDLTVASSSPASVLLRGGVTLQGLSITRRRLQPCAGHVFNRKLGGRGTGPEEVRHGHLNDPIKLHNFVT